MKDDWKGEALIRHKSEKATVAERKRLVSKIAHMNRKKAGLANPAERAHNRFVTSIFGKRTRPTDA